MLEQKRVTRSEIARILIPVAIVLAIAAWHFMPTRAGDVAAVRDVLKRAEDAEEAYYAYYATYGTVEDLRAAKQPFAPSAQIFVSIQASKKGYRMLATTGSSQSPTVSCSVAVADGAAAEIDGKIICK